MPRVNLDDEFFVDPRIEKLSQSTKEIKELTRGRLIGLFHYCYLKRNPYQTADVIDRYTGWVGEVSYADHMALVKMATRTPDGYYRIAGVENRVQYLLEQSERGKRSAQARMARRGSSKPPGRYWKRQVQAQILPPEPPKIGSYSNEPSFIEMTQTNERVFIEKREILRTNVHSSMNHPAKQPVHNFQKTPVSMNQGSEPYEHILSSKELIQSKEIPRLRSPLSREQIEDQKRAAFKREEESRSADRTAPLTGPPTASGGGWENPA